MKGRLLSVLLIVSIGLFTFSCKRKKAVPEKDIAKTLINQINSFSGLARQLQTGLENSSLNEKQVQQQFLQLRLSYKKFEWAAEYFTPNITRFVNGPPVPEVEMTTGSVLDPAGLQVIEAFLFPHYDHIQKKELVQQLKLLQIDCSRYKVYFNNIDLLNWQIFDAARLEVFRILTLGITGFDNPLTLKSMKEAAVSLQSLQAVMINYTDQGNPDMLTAKIDAAKNYLYINQDFNSFNRAAFITGYGNAITIAITSQQQELHIPLIKYNRLLRQEAGTLFDKDAFDVNAYAPGPSYFQTAKKIALGKKLFADPQLSGNLSRSCSSCHQPDNAFTDKLIKNTVFKKKILLRRNTPTLLNAALQPSQFYDLRAHTLEDQAMDVIQNKDEMHGSMKVLISRLWKNKTYRKLFADAYPEKGRTGIDTLEVTNAIGAFVRSLTQLNSRFDDYMRGDKTSMNTQELNGFNLFMGKAKCATCHYMPLFNGTLPPKYTKMDAEVITVPRFKGKKVIDPDQGAYEVVQTPSFKHAFKTTTVRNASRTAPYMHNGVFSTLDEVVDFYNKGGGAGMGIKTDNQTLSADQLHLTAKETSDLVAFIKSLDSK
ncbi:cytochrome-c peroxidase [Pedobacter sp. L105]|uniref:cytochrome-c peroxidase n=1 Tax=Pedobacter sp. L105 TaxID=1641871 RepID=UPI00131EA0A2|nr:cytochrome c peroxidase [Pedobacter sp. L105]